MRNAVAGAIEQRDFLVGGSWRSSPQQQAVVYPYTGEPIALVASASPQDVEDAIAAAVDAFEVTRRLPAYRRAEILARAGEIVGNQADFLARQMTLETGHCLRDTRGEVMRTAAIFQMAAEEAKRIGGEVVPLDVVAAGEGRVGIVRRFPVGPVVGITAFNAPLLLPAHKIAPAFAAGNPIIVKPAPRTPLSALSLADILLESGISEGAVSVLPCDDNTARPLVSDPRIRALSFTGSTRVGWRLKAMAGQKKVTLELGGNGAVIVHADADLDWAASRCAFGGFLRAGQACISVQRIYVHQDVYDPFVARLVSRVRDTAQGDPLDAETDMGPMIDENAARRAEAWVREALEAGATICAGGERVDSFLQPTILTDVSDDMKVSCEEVFAPIVTVVPYTELDEALRRVNDTPYGLQAGIFCNDLRLVYRAYEELQVGGVIVNDVNTWRVDNMPYGGVKASGYGREGVKWSIEELTEPRLLALNVR